MADLYKSRAVSDFNTEVQKSAQLQDLFRKLNIASRTKDMAAQGTLSGDVNNILAQRGLGNLDQLKKQGVVIGGQNADQLVSKGGGLLRTIGNVAKIAAPIAASFIPGVGPFLGTMLGRGLQAGANFALGSGGLKNRLVGAGAGFFAPNINKLALPQQFAARTGVGLASGQGLQRSLVNAGIGTGTSGVALRAAGVTDPLAQSAVRTGTQIGLGKGPLRRRVLPAATSFGAGLVRRSVRG